MKNLKESKKEVIVYVDGIRYRKSGKYLVLDQVISNTIDKFHTYSGKQSVR